METNETSEVQPNGIKYKLRLEGGGVTVEREIDEAVALQVLAAVMGGLGPAGARAARPAAPTPTRAYGGGVPSDALSVREYLDEAEPKRNVDKILTIASYLKYVRGMKTFIPDDVKREFRLASEPVPGNYARDFKWAIANGWIAPAHDMPGEYFVTLKGEQAVESKFSEDVKKTTGVGRTARRRRTRKKGDET